MKNALFIVTGQEGTQKSTVIDTIISLLTQNICPHPFDSVYEGHSIEKPLIEEKMVEATQYLVDMECTFWECRGIHQSTQRQA
jgi:hypothetical protein